MKAKNTISFVSIQGASARRSSRTWRGNTLVLVAGILVLLVIIATTYLTRTQTQRSTSIAQQASAQREDNAELIAEMLAQTVADALFVWPVDFDGDQAISFLNNGTVIGVADANFPRLPPRPDAQRYGVDEQFLPNSAGDFVLVRVPYNFAPYHTVPFTNWPDYVELASSWNLRDINDYRARWLPSGPGNQYFVSDSEQAGDGEGDAAIAALLSAESNPAGNPGFGDNRWLRDFEPVRWDTGQFSQGTSPGVLDAFSHWRKLTNIATANNGWRIVADIADVDANIVGDLSIPVEQWLDVRPSWGAGTTPFNPATGNVNFVTLFQNDRFWRQWTHWFGLGDGSFPFDYTDLYVNAGFGAPPNLYKLNDLNANGTSHNYFINGIPQDRPESEFIRGTARNLVSRVLTDTTGDGITDSFWFLAPTPARGGIRQVIGVSIVDNSGRLNANVATRFQRNDPTGTNWDRRKTRSHTPADLALVGELNPSGENVGFYDNADNWASSAEIGITYNMQYRPPGPVTTPLNRWNNHLFETGLPFTGNLPSNPNPANHPLFAEDRLDYWQYAGRHGLRYSPGTTLSASGRTYRPFELSDELELRMFEGHNHPWVFSRYEFSVQAENDNGMLRASRENSETNEYLDQLFNRELVRDTRRKLTMYSGARNEQTDPGLHWFARPRVDYNNAQSIAFKYESGRYTVEPPVVQDLANNMNPNVVYDNFAIQANRKLDLREPDFWYHTYDADGFPLYYDSDDSGRLNLRDRLARSLLKALTDGPDELQPRVIYNSYYGRYRSDAASTDPAVPVYNTANSPLNKTRRLAAAYAANILAYRSNQPVTLLDRVLLPEFGYAGTLHANHPYAAEFGTTSEANYIGEGQLESGSSEEISFLPIDAQPFLVEAFVAHVYRSSNRVPRYYVQPADELDGLGVDCYAFDNLEEDDIPAEFTVQRYSNQGDHVILNREDDRSVIAVVQIANPFDVPVDLWQYRIKLLGNDWLELRNVLISQENRWLPPATDGNPTTAIFYAMKDTLGPDNLAEKWREFLDIDIIEAVAGQQVAVAGNNERLAPGTLVVNVTSGQPGGTWSVTSRENYDHQPSAPTDGLILSKLDESTGVDTWIEVDRMDPRGTNAEQMFRNAVRYMGRYAPPLYDPICDAPPYNENGDLDTDDPDYDEESEGRYPSYVVESATHHWIQWVRATRAWGADLNGNGIYEDHERNPRFVFGDRTVVVATERGTPFINNADPSDGNPQWSRPRRFSDGHWLDDGAAAEPEPGQQAVERMGANMYNFADDPNQIVGDTVLPWFARIYYTADGRLMNQDPADITSINPARKPTFFDMNVWNDPLNISAGPNFAWSYPDKGWYGQFSINPMEFDPIAGEYQIYNVGGSVRLPALVSSSARFNGVEDPPVLTDTTLASDGSSLNWSGPITPMFRHNFGMQMTLKNKMSVQHFGSPPQFPVWYNDLNADSQDALVRNYDFEQVGEVLNVWLFGHELRGNSSLGTYTYDTTLRTFSEFMSGQQADYTGLPRTFGSAQAHRQWLVDDDGHRVNRLRMRPTTTAGSDVGAVINEPHRPDPASATYAIQLANYRADARQAWPSVPAGTRVLDLFVCDGPGRWPYDELFDTFPTANAPLQQESFIDELRFYNANNFSGRMTPGLININAATPEVLRALPHMSRMVHETFNPADNPSPLIAQAIVRYRDRMGSPVFNADNGPAYAHRGRTQDFFADATMLFADATMPGDNTESKFIPTMRGERGFATIGELALLTQSGRLNKQLAVGSFDEFVYQNVPNANDAFDTIDINSSWRIDYPMMADREAYRQEWPLQLEPGAGNNPYAYIYTTGAPGYAPAGVTTVSRGSRISTDTVDVFDPDATEFNDYPAGFRPDFVSEDTHEANLLLAGISNLVTTRSDTFTVHFRVRSFRQNPVTGVWDATDPDYIVDDVRYVMLVDRSEVNRPSDKPRILYLERLPK